MNLLARTRFRLALVLLAGASVASPIHGQTAPQASPAQAGLEDPGVALSRNLATLSESPNSLAALLGAGNAAVALGDPEAALTFLSKAEELAPRDGRVKAAIGSALVMMEQGRTALRFFEEARTLGAAEADFAGYRGLAYDLTGDTVRAQRDYRLALTRREDGEVRRRFALSLAIAGNREAALAAIDGQLRRQDRAAWRARAFILALTGDAAGATQAVQAVMPAQASAMAPFLARLPSLSPADRALAVNFGHFPGSGQIGQLAATSVAPRPLTAPPMTPPAAARAAPSISAGSPGLAPAASAPSSQPTTVASVAPRAATPTPSWRSTPLPSSSPPMAVRPPAAPPPATMPLASAAAPSLAPAAMAPSSGGTAAVAGPTTALTPGSSIIAAPLPSANPPPDGAGLPAVAPSSLASTVSIQSTPIAPSTPAPSIAEPVAAPPSISAPATQLPPIVQVTPPPARSFAEVATLVSSLSAASDDSVTITPDAAEPMRPAPRPPAVQRPRSVALADRPQTSAPAAAKPAAKTSGGTKASSAKPDKPAKEPARKWVQIGHAGSPAVLPSIYEKVKSHAPKLFAARTAWTASQKGNNRLLVGPFKSDKEAEAFVSQLERADVESFSWASPAGLEIKKLK